MFAIFWGHNSLCRTLDHASRKHLLRNFPMSSLAHLFSAVFAVEEFCFSWTMPKHTPHILRPPPPPPLKNMMICPLYCLPSSLKSSTTITPLSRSGGVLLMTLCTVRRRTDSRSLWKQIMTVVVGSLAEYVLCLLLQLFG